MVGIIPTSVYPRSATARFSISFTDTLSTFNARNFLEATRTTVLPAKERVAARIDQIVRKYLIGSGVTKSSAMFTAGIAYF